MKVFLELEPFPVIIRPLPLRRYHDMTILSDGQFKKVINLGMMQKALEKMHSEVGLRKVKRRARVQLIQNAETNVSPLNIEVKDHVFIRTHSLGNHKLQTKWKGPMRVVEAKPGLVFILKIIVDAN